jgi:hypothetical protein
VSTSDAEREASVLPSGTDGPRRGVLRPPHLSTAAKVITATVTTGAALVAIVSGILNVQSRIGGDVVATDGMVTLHDVRFEEAMIPTETALSAKEGAPSVRNNRVTFTVESSGGPHEVQVEYALFEADTFRRLAAEDENAVWGSLGLGGETSINLWIDVPVEPEGRCIFARIYLVPVMDPDDCVPECAPIARYDIADSAPFDSHTGAPCMTSTPPR